MRSCLDAGDEEAWNGRRLGGSKCLSGARADKVPAAYSGGSRFLGVPMSRDGNRPRSWANPTLIQEETDWVASCSRVVTDPSEGESIAKLRGPHSDFIPTAPNVAFEALGGLSTANEPADPWSRHDPWSSASLPRGSQRSVGDAWKDYRNPTAAGPAGSGDPYGSVQARMPPQGPPSAPQPRD